MSDLCCIVAGGFLLMGAVEGITNGLGQVWREASPEGRWALAVPDDTAATAALGGAGAGLLAGEAWGWTTGLGVGLLVAALLCVVCVLGCAFAEAMRQRRQW